MVLAVQDREQIPKGNNGLLRLGTMGPFRLFRPWDESSFKGFLSPIVEKSIEFQGLLSQWVGPVFLLLPVFVCYLTFLTQTNLVVRIILRVLKEIRRKFLENMKGITGTPLLKQN